MLKQQPDIARLNIANPLDEIRDSVATPRVLQYEGRSLRVNSAWALTGNVIYALCQWGMLVVLAKLGSPEMLGQFALALAVVAPIIMFSMLQLRTVQATDATREYQFGHYLALRIATSVLALLAIAVVVISFGYRGEIALIILLVGLLKAVESVSDACHGLMQQRERIDRIALAKIIKGPAFIVALSLTVFLTESVLWGTAALVVASFAVFLGYEWPNIRRLLSNDHPGATGPVWQRRRLVALAWLGLPLGLAAALVSLNSAVPRYIIERMLGERELGYFAALASFQAVIALVGNAISQTITPRLSCLHARGNRKAFVQLLLHVTGLGLLFGSLATAIATFFGRELLTVVYRPDYADHAPVLVSLMIAVTLATLTGFLGSGIHAARCFRAPLLASACMIGITLVAGALMIPECGLLGAALAILFGNLVRLACSLAIVLIILGDMPENPRLIP